MRTREGLTPIGGTPTREDLKNLEVFCKREECGDVVVDRFGKKVYNKRRMNFMGFSAFADRAIFKCPVCGRERKFAISAWTNKIHEI